MDRELLTPAEIAAARGVSRTAVTNWLSSGLLPAEKVGGKWRVERRVLDAFPGAMVGRNARPFNRTRQLRAQRAAGMATLAEHYVPDGACPRCGGRFGLETSMLDLMSQPQRMCVECEALYAHDAWGAALRAQPVQAAEAATEG